jgi:hypothetical protein
MAHESLDQATLNQIHGNQMSMLGQVGEVKSQVAGVVSDVRHIKDQVDRNTGQISEIRRTDHGPTPQPQTDDFTLLSLFKKAIPFLGYMLAGAALVGAAFADKILK